MPLPWFLFTAFIAGVITPLAYHPIRTALFGKPFFRNPAPVWLVFTMMSIILIITSSSLYGSGFCVLAGFLLALGYKLVLTVFERLSKKLD